jgi:tungstate transport system permease protein
MGYIFDGIGKAFQLILSLDREIISIALVSIKVSFVSITLAALVGVPFGFYVAIKEFCGKRIVVTVLNTLMALPTVVVGLTVYSLISRRGPFGSLGLLYTPLAMVIGQFILATPIVAALSLTATQSVDKRVMKTALALGATGLQSMLVVFKEVQFAVLTAVIAGFGRIFAEVGV